MAVEDAMVLLTEQWDDVIARLDGARGQELRGLITQIGGAEGTGAVIRITQLLVSELPPEHPVRRALAEDDLYVGAPTDWAALRDLLVVVARTPDAEPVAGQDDASAPAGTVDETPAGILAEVTARLLRAPALTERDVRLRGADPADPGLLRLDRPDGGQQWPSFQFAADGGPLSVVRTVNTLLGAETDPLGVADWWLGANPWLDGRPSDLIGDVPDEVVLRAARAVIEEV
ncbi:MAG TPA: hypothetical protein VII59_13485 [Streptosporangiaceae bacterium]|jgi:hypothetical protein